MEKKRGMRGAVGSQGYRVGIKGACVTCPLKSLLINTWPQGQAKGRSLWPRAWEGVRRSEPVSPREVAN